MKTVGMPLRLTHKKDHMPSFRIRFTLIIHSKPKLRCQDNIKATFAALMEAAVECSFLPLLFCTAGDGSSLMTDKELEVWEVEDVITQF